MLKEQNKLIIQWQREEGGKFSLQTSYVHATFILIPSWFFIALFFVGTDASPDCPPASCGPWSLSLNLYGTSKQSCVIMAQIMFEEQFSFTVCGLLGEIFAEKNAWWFKLT